MITNDYLGVGDLARQKKVTMKTVRNKIQKLIGVVGVGKIIKDNNNEWRIHNSIKDLFDPERVHRERYKAITIDPIYSYTREDLIKIVQWVVNCIDKTDVEICYTIEQKKSNYRNHLHFYMAKELSGKFQKAARRAFPEMDCYVAEIYDLSGWKNYIGKESKIITIKK